MAKASVTNAGCFSVATVTMGRSVFRFLGKMSVNKVGNCGSTFRVRDGCALVFYGRNNRRATVPKVTEMTMKDVIRLSARTLNRVRFSFI